MKALLGLILSEDGSIRDITLLASTGEDRKRAHQLLFFAQDEIDKFEASMKARLQSIPTAHVRPNLSG